MEYGVLFLQDVVVLERRGLILLMVRSLYGTWVLDSAFEWTDSYSFPLLQSFNVKIIRLTYSMLKLGPNELY